MKLKNKITVTVVPILLLAVVSFNIAFGKFFQDFILAQEEQQIELSKHSLSSFFEEKRGKYIGTVNDWAHWDDTYHFIQGDNERYIDNNLTEDTYDNLDLSFVLLLDSMGNERYRGNYSWEEESFIDFPEGIGQDLRQLTVLAAQTDDTFGTYWLGDGYYFITTSQITDSEKQLPSAGLMVIGRRLDDTITQSIQNITGSSLLSIDRLHGQGAAKAGGPSSIAVRSIAISQDNQNILIDFIPVNTVSSNSAITFSLSIPRSLFHTAMSKVGAFILISTIISLFVALTIFLLIERFLSSPFTRLVQDVGAIDASGEKLVRIPDHGNDEFAYLRKSINGMLDRIESEHNQVISHQERLHATLLSVGDGVVSVDNSGKVQFMNPVAEALTGWTQAEAIGMPLETVFRIVSEYTREPVESPVQTVLATGEIVELSNHTLLVSKDDIERAIEDTAAPIRDMSGHTIGCVLVFRDFSERKERQRRIEYLSYHDQLSDLYNRRFFEEELKRLDVKRNLPLSFLYSDVNGLKTINDAFGHQCGDQLIREVSEAMKSECRADDIIARTGGDEFIILLPKTDSHSAEKIAERIRERVEQIRFMEINTSMAFGWSTKILEGQDVWEVLKGAENMMYQKKILNAASKRNAVIRSILNALLVKSPRENAHSRRVSRICGQIASAYGLSDDETGELMTAGELHDIGKIAVDETVLNKQSALSEPELAQLKHHPETGYRLLSMSSEFCNIAEYVLAHHERWDGFGYPRRLIGEAIPWKARIIAVADSFDAMTSDRPYRKTMSMPEAITELKNGAGTQFDPDIARTFVEKVLGESW